MGLETNEVSPVFKKLAFGEPVTREEIEEFRGYLEIMNNHCEAAMEKVTPLAEMDLDQLDEAASLLAEFGGYYKGLIDVLQQLSDYVSDSMRIKDALDEFSAAYESFEDASDEWLGFPDGDNSTAAKKALDKLYEVAVRLDEVNAELVELGVDLTAEIS